MRRITLLTDFGSADGYVGAMKGVIASIVPNAALDDVSHDLPAGDVAAASRALGRYWRRYAAGSVHLVVVDPGVGTARRGLAIEADRRLVVVPDNGAASTVLAAAHAWRAVALENEEFHGSEGSTTFHGRDVFAPVAAHLARGTPLERLGPEVADPARLEEPAPERRKGGVRGEVVAVDRFGNLQTNVPAGALEGAVEVELAGVRVPVRPTYGDVGPGEPVALVNSDGRLEVAVRNGSARVALEAGEGSPVRVVSGDAGG